MLCYRALSGNWLLIRRFFLIIHGILFLEGLLHCTQFLLVLIPILHQVHLILV